MSEERSFEVVDKRRVRAEGTAPGGAPAAQEEPVTGSEEVAETGQHPASGHEHMHDHEHVYEHEHEHEYEEGEVGSIPDVRVADILRMSVQLLSEKAWVSMGLVANPGTGKVEKDLAEARRGIDAAADMIKHLEVGAAPVEKRELQNLLQDLRVNFLRQSTSSGSQ